jgi:molecular chaperone GrpE
MTERGPRIKVEDKRHSTTSKSPPGEPSEAATQTRQPAPAEGPEAPKPSEPAHDYLDDLRRLQAEFDNYRKRVVREQTAMASRASARLVERLLPVLDNFEAALAHGEGGPGAEMVYKQLKGALEEEGLEEIPAQGVPFDPTLHEAFEAHEDAEVEEPMSVKVLRRGYRIKGKVLRHAMVSVARPAEDEPPQEAEG